MIRLKCPYCEKINDVNGFITDLFCDSCGKKSVAYELKTYSLVSDYATKEELYTMLGRVAKSLKEGPILNDTILHADIVELYVRGIKEAE